MFGLFIDHFKLNVRNDYCAAGSLMSNTTIKVVRRDVVSSCECYSGCVLSALDAGEVRCDEAHHGWDA